MGIKAVTQQRHKSSGYLRQAETSALAGTRLSVVSTFITVQVQTIRLRFIQYPVTLVEVILDIYCDGRLQQRAELRGIREASREVEKARLQSFDGV